MTSTLEPTPTNLWQDVRRLADEVRLKVHLAGMELKDQWDSLEPELREVEQKLDHVGTKIEGAVASQLTRLGTSLRKLADDLRNQPAPK